MSQTATLNQPITRAPSSPLQTLVSQLSSLSECDIWDSQSLLTNKINQIHFMWQSALSNIKKKYTNTWQNRQTDRLILHIYKRFMASCHAHDLCLINNCNMQMCISPQATRPEQSIVPLEDRDNTKLNFSLANFKDHTPAKKMTQLIRGFLLDKQVNKLSYVTDDK